MRLFLLMLIVTSIEVILIAKVGSALGFFPTCLLIIFTALLGSRLLSKQWRFVMGKMQTLQDNPSQTLIEALVLLMCGVLLVTPGFLTDILGFAGLVPVIREKWVVFMQKNSGRFTKGGFQFYGQSTQSNGQSESSNDNIIEGEFERKDSND